MPHILNIPADLLIEIAQHVLRPGPTSQYITEATYRQFQDYESLAFLSRTCKTWHEISQSILYRTAFVSNGYCIPLVRTLVEKPHLAAHVRALHIDDDWRLDRHIHTAEGDYGFDKWVISPDEAALFNKVVREYQIEQPSGFFYGGKRDSKKPVQSLRADCFVDDDTMGLLGLMTTLAILHCRLVQCISIVIGSYWNIYRAKRVDFLFNRLVKLELSYSRVDMSLDIDSNINWLFAAAPSLTSLKGTSVGSIMPTFHAPNVTSLELWESYLNENVLEALYCSIPTLKRFTYTAGGPNMTNECDLSPAALVHALGRWKGTLKYLYLDYLEEAYDQQDGWEEGDGFVETLRELSNLEELRFQLNLFNARTSDVTAEFLIEKLPSSICTLHCDQETLDPWSLDALLEVVPDHFPKLKLIRLLKDETEQSELLLLQEEFAKKGIILKLE